VRILNILNESLALAFSELVHNRLRAFLSLLGITIGIFCIIAVFGAVDSLESDIRGSMKNLGEDAVYVTKWPWAFADENYAWWEYMKRPESNYADFGAIRTWADKASAIAIEFTMQGKTAKHGDNAVENASVMAASHDYNKVYNLKLAEGRYFSTRESQGGDKVAIVGANLAKSLAQGGTLLGGEIRLIGQRFRVIGIMEKEGQSIIDFGFDDRVIIPYKSITGLVNVNNPQLEQSIIVTASQGVSLEELKSQLRGVMRVHRRLRPSQDDNFSLNEMSVVNQGLSAMFGVIRFAGGFIGIFSILVGGFGIANIMFVSVKERTGIIGIKKALGARNGFILSEFLIEAVILCITGGVLGLIGVYALMQLVNASDIGMTFVLSAGNIITGLVISASIGVISGLAPALWAARMDPVVAMRS